MNQELKQLPLDSIRPDPNNPRKEFDPELLQGLADSIAANGLEQPITVRPDGEGYILIAGERRFRAHQLIGATTITAIVRTGISADEAATRQVIENLQRADLNPIDEARGFQHLLDQLNLSQGELAKQLGVSRPKVAKALGLLKRPEEVQRALASGKITARHAEAINGLDDAAQVEAVTEIAAKKLTTAATRQRFGQAATTRACSPANTSITARPRHRAAQVLVKAVEQLLADSSSLEAADREAIQQATTLLTDLTG
jgi:ParB family chromosome partitioning protein